MGEIGGGRESEWERRVLRIFEIRFVREGAETCKI